MFARVFEWLGNLGQIETTESAAPQPTTQNDKEIACTYLGESSEVEIESPLATPVRLHTLKRKATVVLDRPNKRTHLERRVSDITDAELLKYDIPLRPLPCIIDLNLEKLCDLTIFLFQSDVDAEPVGKTRSSRILLGQSCGYFRVAFLSGMKESHSPIYRYFFIEGETLDSAIAFLDIMTSRDIEKRLKRLVANQSMETIAGVFKRFGQVLQGSLQHLLLTEAITQAKTVQDVITLLGWEPLKTSDTLYAHAIQQLIKLAKSTRALVLAGNKGMNRVILPKKLLVMMWKDYLEGCDTPYVDSSADIWILARMGNYQDLAEEIEVYLPCAFACYLWKNSDPGKHWWVPFWGHLLEHDTYIDVHKLSALVFADLATNQNTMTDIFAHQTWFRFATNLAKPKGKTQCVTLKVPFNYKTHKIYVAGLMWRIHQEKAENGKVRVWVHFSPRISVHILRIPYKVQFEVNGLKSPPNPVTIGFRNDIDRDAKKWHTYTTNVTYFNRAPNDGREHDLVIHLEVDK